MPAGPERRGVFVGHAFVAFAIGAVAADRLGASRDRALLFGVAAGAFAFVPDVDMLYAVVGLLQADPTGVWDATAAFWDASKAVHRAVTHSLLVAGPAAAGFALAAGRRGRYLAAGPLLAVVALGWFADGPLAAVMLGVFAAGGVAVAIGAARLGLDQRAILLAALLGLVTHPFGDLFTGAPPPLFYPIGAEVFGDRVTLLADPTLNLLAVFAIELAAIWLGVGVALRFVDRSAVELVEPRAGIGALYGAAVFVLPPPTLETSYHFVFSVLAVGSVGAVPLVGRLDRERAAGAAVSALAAITLAGAAYAVAYVLA